MRKALVVLSGGQDSTTCLYYAKKYFEHVEAITFDYGQRHSIEIDAAKIIAAWMGVPHEVVQVHGVLRGTSPLVDPNVAVEHYSDVTKLPGGIEKTFVPARNTLFLTIAANRAVALKSPDGIAHIFTGVSQEDYGGYPDCRERFIVSLQQTLSFGITGTDGSVEIHTPLLYLNKEETVRLAQTLDPCMDALAYSHTCYKGEYPPCGACHACLLRSRGFRDAGVPDPLVLRAKREGELPSEYPDYGWTGDDKLPRDFTLEKEQS